MFAPRPCSLFLFDLDGTLVDSREDITRAVNSVLGRMGKPALPLQEVLRFVGDGVEALIRRALRQASGEEPGKDQIRAGVHIMMEEYGRHLVDATRLYPDVIETLDALRRARLGIVTNKPEQFARRILTAFDLADRFCVILGGDSLPERKPDPAPIIAAMTRCHALPFETVMIGDSPTDVRAGRAAGACTCGFAGGYRSRRELQDAACDLIVDRLTQLLQFFIVPLGT
jgi:phosphoglycolate phosphatase